MIGLGSQAGEMNELECSEASYGGVQDRHNARKHPAPHLKLAKCSLGCLLLLFRTQTRHSSRVVASSATRPSRLPEKAVLLSRVPISAASRPRPLRASLPSQPQAMQRFGGVAASGVAAEV